ncbi:MAG: homoserine O-acetyltransferase [Acidimicrobiales bacterium]
MSAPVERVPIGPEPLPVTGAWRPGDPVADRRFLHRGERPFALEGGGVLAGYTLAYETWGTLDADGANAVLVCHALTGDAHAAGASAPGQPSPGWWDELIGPGRALDTTRLFVVCANVLGGCQGSTGPASEDPVSGRPYGRRFPVVTIRDMVRSQAALADHLGVDRWLAVVGGSMGGMQVLEWGVMFPERVRSLVAIATCGAATAQQIAYSTVQRSAIALDPAWRGGDYYEAAPGDGPHRGLAVARALAQITYRSDQVFGARFGRGVVDDMDDVFTLWQRFDVEGYLDYQGAKLVRRFDANAYLTIAKAMDLHDLGRGRGGMARALSRLRAPLLTMSITTDALYFPYQQEEVRDLVRAAGGTAEHAVIDSPHGHDAFLLETDQVAAAVAPFLADVEKQT